MKNSFSIVQKSQSRFPYDVNGYFNNQSNFYHLSTLLDFEVNSKYCQYDYQMDQTSANN